MNKNTKYLVVEYDIKTEKFGKVVGRDLKIEETKDLMLELGAGYVFGKKEVMKSNFNIE